MSVFLTPGLLQATISTNHLINTIRLLSSPHNQHQLQQLTPLPSNAPQDNTVQHTATVVVGDDYYAAKDQLLIAEQHVLRVMQFQVNIDHPYKYLLNLCNLLQVSKPTAAAAVCLLNDCLTFTDLCIKQSPYVTAAAVLYASMQLQAQSDVDNHHDAALSTLQQAVGVPQQQLMDSVALLVDMSEVYSVTV
eukprot:jgi/Chrzof1/13349/Cz07g29230.t1